MAFLTTDNTNFTYLLIEEINLQANRVIIEVYTYHIHHPEHCIEHLFAYRLKSSYIVNFVVVIRGYNLLFTSVVNYRSVKYIQRVALNQHILQLAKQE